VLLPRAAGEPRPKKKIDVSGYPTDPKFLLPTLKILS
jgi:hypothetical protein